MVWERCSPKPWLLLGDTWRGRTGLKTGISRKDTNIPVDIRSHRVPSKSDRRRLPGDAEAGAVGGGETGAGRAAAAAAGWDGHRSRGLKAAYGIYMTSSLIGEKKVLASPLGLPGRRGPCG